MLKAVGQRRYLPVVGFIALCAALSLSTLGFAAWTTSHQMAEQSRLEAERWAEHIASQLPEAAAIARGGPISAETRSNLRALTETEPVHALRIYNRLGTILVQTSQIDGVMTQTAADRAPQGARVEKQMPLAPTVLSHPASGGGFTVQLPLYAGNDFTGRMEVDIARVNGPYSLDATLQIALILLIALGLATGYGSIVMLRQRRLAAQEYRDYTQHDPLTGLVNHRGFMKLVTRHMPHADADEKPGCLILVEMRGLDDIGQAHGIQAAETAITITGQRLSEIKPAGCDLAAVGYGRFGLYAPDINDAMDVLALAKSVTTKLSMPIAWNNDTIQLSAHAGIALTATDGSDAEQLLHSAELALKLAQEQGTNGYSFFNPAIARDARRRVSVQRAVADALKNETFRLDFQPVYEFRTGQLAGFEALLRLHDTELGAISPAEFIPIAEQAGLINSIGAWCLREACSVASQWPPHLVVAVNLSPYQFYSGTLINDVRHALNESSLASYRLEVEITEGTLLNESELVLQQLGVLRDMGISVALDDFGTGYSSLSYLWKFPFSKIKIDRSFVNALGQSQNARGILRTIIKLGHSLGFAVTAEGIETQAQFTTLRELHCNLAQGYLLDKPARVTDLAGIILRNFANGMPQKVTTAIQGSKARKSA